MKLLTVVFLIESVICIQDVNLKNLNIKTLTALLNILSKYENDVAYVKIQPNTWKQKQNHRESKTDNVKNLIGIIDDYTATDKKFQRPGKQILIKRLLPHGLTPIKIEFDNKFKTFYRPLVRVHKRIPVPKIDTILQVDDNANGMDKYGIDLYDYYDNDENVLNFAVNRESDDNLKHFKLKKVDNNFDVDEALLQPFIKKIPENSNYESLYDFTKHLKVVADTQQLLKRIRSRSNRSSNYRDIIKILDKISSLRSNLKSGEDNDDMAPGKLVNENDDDVDAGPQEPKKWLSHYAPWNFWTYNKIIYQDECPDGQVKIANLCIWLPPH